MSTSFTPDIGLSAVATDSGSLIMNVRESRSEEKDFQLQFVSVGEHAEK